MKEQEEKHVDVAQNATTSIPYKERVEISEEAKQERLALRGMLLQQSEDLVKESQTRKKKRDEEVIELLGGQKVSIAEINAAITATLQPYVPMFPNSVPFFSEIYRLNGWKDKNPNDFVKPTVVASWINEIIYGRFAKDVLPTLRVLNPASPFGLRVHKHFQYLTEAGQSKLVQYRDEAIALMQTCSSWYEFRKKIYEVHGVPYQISLFEK
ncbi:P63C domain-containing protein [Rufibacter immobilis]|uniref:P63C domain-containing protein n=1 Tax=Rufibacter immobilis TaxID=1348778 RepID=UPI0035ED83A4